MRRLCLAILGLVTLGLSIIRAGPAMAVDDCVGSYVPIATTNGTSADNLFLAELPSSRSAT